MATQPFVESLALWFEHSGVPRMAGRVLGYLLVCDPSQQSAEQLAAALQASRGSISATTRMLVASELIERVTFPGDRRTYFRARSDWSGLLQSQFKRVVELRQIVEAGLDALADEPPERRRRLRDVHAFAGFWEQHLAELLEQRTGGQ